MSKLLYDIPFIEEYYDTEEAYYNRLPQKTVKYNLPHEKQIVDWIPKEWNNMHMERFFDGVLKDKVDSCIMKPMTRMQDDKKYAFGRVAIKFVQGFRLSQKLREECWEQLDAQMTDGFGETYDAQQIPNAPENWCVQF